MVEEEKKPTPDKETTPPSTIVDGETPEPQPEKPRPRSRRKKKQPATWKPQEFVAKKEAAIGNKQTVAVGDPVTPASPRQEDEMKKRGVI